MASESVVQKAATLLVAGKHKAGEINRREQREQRKSRKLPIALPFASLVCTLGNLRGDSQRSKRRIPLPHGMRINGPQIIKERVASLGIFDCSGTRGQKHPKKIYQSAIDGMYKNYGLTARRSFTQRR